MPLIMPGTAARKVAASADPKQAIIDSVGDLSGCHLTKDDVLLGTYFRPEKTQGGVFMPDSVVDEDAWQGKVGLILKLGPAAFQDTNDYQFQWDESGPLKVGDWVVYKIGDTWSLNIRKYSCRIVRDINIRLKVDDPSIIF